MKCQLEGDLLPSFTPICFVMTRTSGFNKYTINQERALWLGAFQVQNCAANSHSFSCGRVCFLFSKTEITGTWMLPSTKKICSEDVVLEISTDFLIQENITQYLDNVPCLTEGHRSIMLGFD